ncbi:GNAT family N-acetyltransferase [Clostridium algoriphilum]|uniref:GNAT family N-acetyltransferase n=1 Tax=Clostridium algoriphilum TaxID=198347 RepID=UPI001CF18C44|nr:GNAT family N-acetyltransferase [Clostridium algoriphilum]MCB2294247.1 GNAT family N-acetyltransferase [Clostridium algoriphilum]
MKFTKATEKDVNSIMNIIEQAQAYFKEHAINQWQDNYPNLETVKNDITNENGYVLLKDNDVVGTVVVTFDGDKNYEFIYNGKWTSNDKYAVIHRMAIESKCKGIGLSSVIIKNIERICLDMSIHSIRIDTHKENISMQKLLQKNGFKYCGIIYLEDKSKRIAFERML